MRTSNIILTSLIGSITVIMLTGMMQFRIIGHRGPSHVDFDRKNIALPAFRYLVVTGSSITVGSSAEAGIELTAEKGKPMPEVTYHLQGDTLYFEGVQTEESAWAYSVEIRGEHIAWIAGRDARITIRDVKTDRLALRLDKTSVHIQSHDELKMRSLKVEGVNSSYVSADHSVMPDTLDLHLDGSRADIHAPVHKLKGVMENGSELGIKRVDDFEFRKDESSKLHHWN